MLTRSFLLPIAVVAILTGVLHLLAIELYLYWSFWWFDVLLHFLGGVWVAFTTYWFLFLARVVPSIPLTIFAAIVLMLLITLLVGVSWEIYERTFRIYSGPNYAIDTTIDILMDVIGVLVAVLYILKSRFGAVLE